MSSITLKHSGGNSVSIAAPSSNPAADRTITLPSTDSGTLLTTTNPKPGNVIQVVQTVKSDVASTTSQSWTDLSGLSASLTPSSASNKILVTAFLGQFSAADMVYIGLCTGDGTGIIQGDTVSGAESSATGAYHGGNSQGEAWYSANPATIVKLHSPNTTSSVTYKIRWKVNSQPAYLNRNRSDSGQYALRCASSLTLMEVAA